MPPDPIRAKGLNQRERYIAVARLRINNAGVRNLHFKKAHALELLRDEKFWLIMAMGYLSMIAAGPVNAFVPLIVAVGFQVGVFKTLLYLSPGGIFIGLCILATTYLAYKVKNMRCYIIFVAQLFTVTAASLLWKLPISNIGGLLFACYILPGFSCGWSLLMGLSIANTAGYTKRVISSSGIYLGYCLGNYVGQCQRALHVGGASSIPGTNCLQANLPDLYFIRIQTPLDMDQASRLSSVRRQHLRF